METRWAKMVRGFWEGATDHGQNSGTSVRVAHLFEPELVDLRQRRLQLLPLIGLPGGGAARRVQHRLLWTRHG